MSNRRALSAEFKARVVLEVLSGSKSAADLFVVAVGDDEVVGGLWNHRIGPKRLSHGPCNLRAYGLTLFASPLTPVY